MMFRTRKRVLLCACATMLFLFPGCKDKSLSQSLIVRPPDTTVVVTPIATKRLLFNQHYGDDSLQTVDIYLPEGRSAGNTHLMVFIHGGGWAGGDKSDFTAACEGLVVNKDFAPAYAFININYRLVIDGKNRLPTAENDVVAALNYVWEHADSFKVSPMSTLIGASAGGQLATLAAYKHNEKKHIKSVVSTWGPYDMKRMYDEGYIGIPDMLKWVTGYTPEENPDLYTTISPLFYVTPDSPPTFLAHGRQDTLVRLDQGIALDSMLTKNGVPHEFYTFDGYHGYSTGDVANEAAGKMFAFIAKYMK